ncbi:hypothetical protein EDWATA_01653 [Edwardsiella tarda ATCC 23685]|uniref:Uncharacterized protein n=1 Tax=Edwardsiella tarda ATCC 23685 TaxID=500638 RepID=D4F4I2_EDWTA|nr:hypothetical protein EDWATA_01653 [Edwardsiella tarda ATCC 23685]
MFSMIGGLNTSEQWGDTLALRGRAAVRDSTPRCSGQAEA